MSPLLPAPGYPKLGLALAFGALLTAVPMRAHAGAACSGTWRLQLAPPRSESEGWLSPTSWCRPATLPRLLTVDVGRGAAGRPTMTGSPLQPVDALFGAGRCEFQFSHENGAIPKNHELFIEVDDTGTVVRGTARCTERTPVTDGKSTGISIDVAVTGTRSVAAADKPAAGSASGPEGSEELVTAVVGACRQRDGDALWKLLTPRFRSEIDQRAAELRRSLPAPDLRRLYGHRGRPAAFTGLAFLRHALSAPGSPDDPCAGADGWQVGPSAASAGGMVVAVERREGGAFALRLTRVGGGWRLDQISQSVETPSR